MDSFTAFECWFAGLDDLERDAAACAAGRGDLLSPWLVDSLMAEGILLVSADVPLDGGGVRHGFLMTAALRDFLHLRAAASPD